MRHFNEHFQATQLRSPSWFSQVLELKRVKHNGLKCFYDGGLCLVETRRWTIEPFKKEYFKRFFMADPMNCLHVIFSATSIERVKYNV